MKVTIIHSGGEDSYLFGLGTGLSKIKDIEIDIIDSDRSEGVFNNIANINYLNYRGSLNPKSSFFEKQKRILKYYFRLFRYGALSDSKILHIQWLFKFYYFDCTIMMVYFKLMGKKLIFTAHNINQGKRDGNDNWRNRLALRFLYNIVDHIIVHNNKMKRELVAEFKVRPEKVSVNRIGLNLKVLNTGLSRFEARTHFNIRPDEQVLLFFGGINEYKGVEYLIESFSRMNTNNCNITLIIAGKARNVEYSNRLTELVSEKKITERTISHFQFIKDDEVEFYFKAADCLVLPYKSVFQSGLHVLSYAFGLPVIATDVGSFKEEDVIEGKTGFVCKPNNPEDLRKTIEKYFDSELYKDLENRRIKIKKWAEEIYSWDVIGENTYKIYKQVINQ